MKNYTTHLTVKTLEEAKNIWEKVPWGRTSHYENEQINNLTIYYRTSNSKYGQPRFVFQCYCGNFAVANGTHLKNGNTTSCGCKQKEAASIANKQRIINIANQRFGHLIALKYIDDEQINKKTNGKAWECKCDCGRICYVGQNTLRKNEQKSCGNRECVYSYGKINLSNYEDEYFKVIGIDPNIEKGKELRWLCQCKECNSIVSKRSIDIRNQKAKSCGCIKSVGEQKIQEILQKNNIFYEKEKTFENCSLGVSKSHPRFDFYVNNEYIIEYDGIQHFKEIDNFFESLEKIQIRDAYKNQYCKEHNIPIIRIPYTHYEDLCIEDLQLETSNYLL